MVVGENARGVELETLKRLLKVSYSLAAMRRAFSSSYSAKAASASRIYEAA